MNQPDRNGGRDQASGVGLGIPAWMTFRAAIHQLHRCTAAEIPLGASREVAHRGERDDATHR